MPSSGFAQDEISPVPDLTGEFPGTRGEEDDWFGYEAPLQFGIQGGETYVSPEWLVTVEHFRPIGNRQIGGDEIVTYVDARFGFGPERRVANLGAGIRYFSKRMNTIVDGNLWYDNDWTETNRFEQITIGGQIQNEWATARLHIYTPIGEEVQAAGFSNTSSTPVFFAQQLSFSRFRFDEVAYQGFDAEVGGILTTAWKESRLYAGIYHFEAETNVPELTGVSDRVEEDLGAGWTASLGVTHDDVTDTSLMFRMTWEIGGVPRGYFGQNIKHRLAEAPRRNYNVVLQERSQLDPLFASSATTGNMLNIIHTRSTASGTGIENGSFENPFTSLADAAAAAAASSTEDIILAHAGSVFDGQGIQLPADTRLLGDGASITVNTAEFGTLALPRGNNLTATPIIQNSPATNAAIQVASNVEVKNVDIRSALGDGLSGNVVDGTVLVQDVSIDGAVDGVAIRTSTSDAAFTFDNLSVANTSDHGIELANNDSGSTFAFTGTTTIDTTADAAFRIGGGAATVGVGNILITNYSARAIDLFQNGGPVSFSNALNLSNSLASTTETIRIQQSDGAVTFDDVDIDDSFLMTATGTPAATVNLLSNSNTVTFRTLTVNATNRTALSALNGSNGDTLRIESGTIGSTNATAVSLRNLTNMSITLQSVSALNATTSGIEIINSGDFASNDVFRIVGLGTDPGAGGTITTTGVGVNIQDSADIFLNFIDITATVAGIRVADSDDITINGNMLQSTSNNWVAIDLNSGLTGTGIGGQNVVTNNNITGSVGTMQTGINLETGSGNPFATEVTFGGNVISLSGATSTGFDFLATGSASSSGTAGFIELLSTGQDNGVSAATDFNSATQNGAEINGQILINGVPMP